MDQIMKPLEREDSIRASKLHKKKRQLQQRKQRLIRQLLSDKIDVSDYHKQIRAINKKLLKINRKMRKLGVR